MTQTDTATASARSRRIPTEQDVAIPPLLEGFREERGVQVSDIGEDGDLIALGHVGKLRALAAFNSFARTQWGLRNLVDGQNRRCFWQPGLVGNVEHDYAVVMTHCRDYPNCPPARWDGDTPATCYKCQDIAGAAWHMRWNASPDEPGAFPVTHWMA